jgi:N-acylneuraminate cytidylyltransferase
MVRCSRSDGLGIARLRETGIPMLILSTEKNNVVAARAAKMNIDAVHGCGNKSDFLKNYVSEKQIDLNNIIYVGNDINDLEAMEMAGFSVCPCDAQETVKCKSDLILSHAGGNGAVRELCELLLAH